MQAFYIKFVTLASLFLPMTTCNYIYAPNSIRGSDALAELEEARTNSGGLSYGITVSTLDVSSTSLENFDYSTCSQTDSIAVTGSSSNTSPTSFTILEPSADGSQAIVDLVLPANSGTYYFRSAGVNVSTTHLTGKLLSNSNYTCVYSNESGCSGNFPTNLTNAKLIRNTTASILVENGQCVSIRCDKSITTSNTETLRLRNTINSLTTPVANPGFDPRTYLIGPEIFNSLTEINEDRYYTLDSFNKCKESVELVGILTFSSIQGSVQQFRNENAVANECLTPLPSFDSSTLNLFGSVLEGVLCEMEEVGILGVI
ncbi:hypothetical protein [Leptospira sp. GIMC2001]|uniref:hypothetical protein n=1 Tax=Leptospira sp. GIMC2001 TaxID=1513297 RepID=UPI00234BF83C|nr:hypothetical protein [Leptospira sp. GIMC2001]WCL48792.1 hypothetical protein O4O04_16010 [Leptospira sp. GIMC2001]